MRPHILACGMGRIRAKQTEYPKLVLFFSSFSRSISISCHYYHFVVVLVRSIFSWILFFSCIFPIWHHIIHLFLNVLLVQCFTSWGKNCTVKMSIFGSCNASTIYFRMDFEVIFIDQFELWRQKNHFNRNWTAAPSPRCSEHYSLHWLTWITENIIIAYFLFKLRNFEWRENH